MLLAKERIKLATLAAFIFWIWHKEGIPYLPTVSTYKNVTKNVLFVFRTLQTLRGDAPLAEDDDIQYKDDKDDIQYGDETQLREDIELEDDVQYTDSVRAENNDLNSSALHNGTELDLTDDLVKDTAEDTSDLNSNKDSGLRSDSRLLFRRSPLMREG